MICSTCKHIIDPAARVCQFCGRKYHPTLRPLGWLALFVAVVALFMNLGNIFGPKAAAPAPASNTHQEIVQGSLEACEEFLQQNSISQVDKVVGKQEIDTQVKDPNTEAWVEIRYRSGGSSDVRWLSCHYAKIGENFSLMDERSGIEQ
jgi:hypothetical protein